MFILEHVSLNRDIASALASGQVRLAGVMHASHRMLSEQAMYRCM